MNKNCEIRNIFGKFVFFGVNPRHYSIKNSIYLYTEPIGQQTLFLLTLFNIPIHKFCRKLDKNCMKTLNVKNFGYFVIFVVTLRNFSNRKLQLSLRASLNVFNILMLDLYRKFDRKSIKMLKFKQFRTFCDFCETTP